LLGAVPAIAAPTGQQAASQAAAVGQAVGTAPGIPPGAHAVGPASPSAGIHFDIVLQPRDARGLQRFATAVSDPGSAEYRHFLSTGQFASRFGQSLAVVQRVYAALRQIGLHPGRISANNLVIPITATVGQASAALHTRIVSYRLATGRLAMANTSAPALPATVARVTQAVIGLSNLITVPDPAASVRSRSQEASSAPAVAGPQPCKAAVNERKRSGGWTYDQLAKAYSLTGLYGKKHEGAGATIALFELQPWSASDISAFQSCYKTSAPVSLVKVDGGATPGPGDETTLDIETAIGLAPKASVLVYDGPGSSYATSTIDEDTRIIDDDRAQVLSISYGLCESIVKSGAPGLIASENVIFEQAASEGISVFVASGDSGSEGCQRAIPSQKQLAVLDPEAQPFVTSVGGTNLTALGPAPKEQVWNEAKKHEGAGGGGISSVWPMPSWQKGPGVSNKFSSGKPCHAAKGNCREVPDVTASADPVHGYIIFYAGKWQSFGGTSAATPLWAAMLADIDSQKSPATFEGFLNPQLYALPTGLLNDIRTGNNDYTGTHKGRYPATARYDLASGLGSPIAVKLATVLRQPKVVFVGRPGTKAPPAKLGPYKTVRFGADHRALNVRVSQVAGPTGALKFTPDLEHLRVGSGWATWSNGYNGDVYYTQTSGQSKVTLTLPPKTVAFFLYAEPNVFSTFNLTATAQNGTSSGPRTVFGKAGARYIGFYATGGVHLTKITITCDDGFAVGEFGITKG
jgi:subtilase family serine protease